MRRLGELSPDERLLYDKFNQLFNQLIPDESAILALINNPAFPVNVENGNGTTPLHYACARGLERVALRLIEKGADVNFTKGDYGHSPLYSAYREGWKRLVLKLIEKAAHVNARDPYGTPLLIVFSREGWKQGALKLIEKGEDVNVSDSTLGTPLIAAYSKEWDDVAVKLIARGAKLNVEAFSRAENDVGFAKVTMQFARTVLLGAMASMLPPHELERLHQLPSDKIKELLDRIVTRLNGVLYMT